MSDRKGEKRRQWDPESMKKALIDVQEHGMKAATAAKIHGVPRKTLTDRLHNKVKPDCSLGKPTYLTLEQEQNLCRYIDYMSQRGFPLTVNQVIMYAWCIDRMSGANKFGEKGPCYGWWLWFKRRHPDAVKLRKADSLDRARALFSTVENLRSYFHLLRQVMDEGGFHERLQDVYNCDESVINLNKSTQKVVVPRRSRAAHSRVVASSEHISIHCCINAAGHSMPPMIIFSKSFPGGNYAAGGPDGALYAKQDSGFMDSELFLKWFEKIFIPNARPTEDNSVLLLMDGHASHCSPQVIEAARQHNVILLALTPHTTHLCQPLDVAVYSSLKDNLGRFIKVGQALKGNLWIPKKQVPRIIKKPFEESMSMANIKAGFRKCGVAPFDPNALDKSRMLRNQLIPNLDVDLSLPPQTSIEEAPSLDVLDASPSIHDVVLEEPELIGVIHDIYDDSSPIEFVNPSTQIASTGLIANQPSTSSHIDKPLINSELINTSEPSVATASSSKPIKICITTGTKRNSGEAETVSSDITNMKDHIEIDVEENTSFHVARSSNFKENPLVKCGIISEDVASIFMPPMEEIPVGRKRPLRQQSKARIMTGNDVYQDIMRQKDQIKEKEERIKKRKEELAKKKNDNEQKKRDTNKRSVQNSFKTNNRSKRSKSGLEDNECFSCTISWTREQPTLQNKWVGCEGRGNGRCPHWVCPRCLPNGFNYNDNYLCFECMD